MSWLAYLAPSVRDRCFSAEALDGGDEANRTWPAVAGTMIGQTTRAFVARVNAPATKSPNNAILAGT